MTIEKGATIPSVTLKTLQDGEITDVNIADYVKGKNVVIFGVPGAYTPVCTVNHLPGFIERAEELKQSGIDEVICVAANDPFVVNHWAKECGAPGKVTVFPDGNLDFTQALGMELDASALGLGPRSQRYSMIVKDGVVESVEVEDEATTVSVSGAEACLSKL